MSAKPLKPATKPNPSQQKKDQSRFGSAWSEALDELVEQKKVTLTFEVDKNIADKFEAAAQFVSESSNLPPDKNKIGSRFIKTALDNDENFASWLEAKKTLGGGGQVPQFSPSAAGATNTNK